MKDVRNPECFAMSKKAGMDFFQGDRVRCLGRPEWGPWFVEADSQNGKVRVAFLGGGRKLFTLRYVKLIKVAPPRFETGHFPRK